MSNLFAAFRSLLPEPRLMIGTVTSAADGTVLVELHGGGSINARGDAAVGDRVFVRNGIVEGPAPSMPVHDLVV